MICYLAESRYNRLISGKWMLSEHLFKLRQAKEPIVLLVHP
jgi:hypothetical protein